MIFRAACAMIAFALLVDALATVSGAMTGGM
jgi:hypothetical protein